MIYDCFTYFNESEILEIRVNELIKLNPIHILVESKYTFTGKEKPLNYADGNVKYNNLINFCAEVPNNGDPWANEHAQRNYIKSALIQAGVKDDDIIIISDVDEIPDKDILSCIKNKQFVVDNIYSLEQDLYLYTITNKALNNWRFAKILTYNLLKDQTIKKIRETNECGRKCPLTY